MYVYLIMIRNYIIITCHYNNDIRTSIGMAYVHTVHDVKEVKTVPRYKIGNNIYVDEEYGNYTARGTSKSGDCKLDKHINDLPEALRDAFKVRGLFDCICSTTYINLNISTININDINNFINSTNNNKSMLLDCQWFNMGR